VYPDDRTSQQIGEPIGQEFERVMAEGEPDPDRRDTGFSSVSRELPPSKLTPRTPIGRVPITTETDPYATPDDLFRGYDELHRELTDFLDTIRRRPTPSMRTGTMSEIRHESRDQSGRPFLSSSVVPLESWERPSPANQGQVSEEVGGASTVGAHASADVGSRLNSSQAVSSAGQDADEIHE